MPENADTGASSSILDFLVHDILYSPLNLGLLALCVFLLFKIFSNKKPEVVAVPPEKRLPPMKKRDMTVQELRKYDGKSNEDGRLCVAVNGKVFDVTTGKRFYGEGGPYACFAGRDATRGLATFSVEVPNNEEYDDLSDLNSMQMDSVREWEMQFNERYVYVGRLLKPGEEPTDYSDEEDASQGGQSSQSTSTEKKDT